MATTLILKGPAAVADAPPVRTDDRGPRRFGFLILLVAFGGFGTWAATAKLDSAAYAPGVVMVESYRKTVQHREGGIVKDILVRDGTSVKEGDVLLRLDDTQDRARLEIIRSQYLALRALEARLVAERDKSEVIHFPEELQGFQHDARVKETLAGQTSVFEARRAALKSEISVLEQQIEQLQAQIDGLAVLQKTEQQRIDSLGEERDDFRKLYKEGHSDKLRLRALERDIAELEGQRAEHLAMIARAKIQIGETRLHILNLQKKFQSEVVTELRDVQTKIFDLEERMHALQDVLARTEIRSPAAGTVVGLGMHTVGGVIAAGNPILDVVPEDTHLVVEAQVLPTDIDKVHAGLLADIRFSAFKTRLTPVVQGTVLTVSADRLTNPVDKHPYYLARIEVSPEGIRQLRDQKLLPGMPAEVIIKTGERTLLDYLVRPLTDAFARSFIED